LLASSTVKFIQLLSSIIVNYKVFLKLKKIGLLKACLRPVPPSLEYECSLVDLPLYQIQELVRLS